MNAPAQNVATQPRRPQPTDFRPLQELTIGEMLSDPRVMKAMAEAAPRHLSPERMLRVMAQAMRKTPKLAQCHPMTLLGAMITCASLGLEPNTPLGHAYLIPFEKREKRGTQWVTASIEVNLILGYQGLIDLARRSGNLVSIHADVVYEGDEFSFEYGSAMHLRHVPMGSREKPTFAYAHAKLSDGEAFEVLPYAQVLKIRDATQAYQFAMATKNNSKNWASTPWVAYEHEMACKTMVRRVSKWLPKSIEFATAAQMDSLAERGLIDFQAIAAQPGLANDPEAAAIDEEPQQQQETAKAAEQPKAAAAKAAAKPAPEPADEVAEAEADRMMRQQQRDEAGDVEEAEAQPAESEYPGEWRDYFNARYEQLTAADSVETVKAIDKGVKASVIDACEKKGITEEAAEKMLALWAGKKIARQEQLSPKKSR